MTKQPEELVLQTVTEGHNGQLGLSPSLLKKFAVLQKAMFESKWQKDGTNLMQKYKYISQEQYKENFKKALKASGLAWHTEPVEVRPIEPVSEKMHLMIVEFVGYLIDVETGESLTFNYVGTGADNGDKAYGKAATMGLKTFLASVFLVAEGDDPDSDSPSPKEEKAAKRPATVEKNTEVKEKITNPDKQAAKYQKTSLKKKLVELKEIGGFEDYVAAVGEETNRLENVTKGRAEELILEINEKLEKAGKK